MAQDNGRSGRIGVLRSRGEYHLILTRPVPADAFLFHLDGMLTDVPTRYSLQVGDATHVDLPEGYPAEAILDRFAWRFMNHSCEPSVVVRDRAVFALKPMESWQEITFHYNSTEYEVAEPFDCHCGSPHCDGRIQGFRFLSESGRELLRPLLAEHLATRLSQPAETSAGPRVPICR